MKQECLICQIVEGKIPRHVVYEDDTVIGILDINGAQLGHCFVIPKQHYAIIEQIPDEDVEHIFSVANNISVALFDCLGVGGTNIFVANGIPAGQTIAHTMVNIIPRSEGDGINLEWEPKKLDEEEMSTVEIRITEQLQDKGFESSKKKPQEVHDHSKEEMDTEENDFLAQQVHRLP